MSVLSEPFLLSPQGLVLLQNCQDMTFHNSVTPPLFIIYTHLPPEEVFGQPYPSRLRTNAIFSLGVCFRAVESLLWHNCAARGLVSISKTVLHSLDVGEGNK